MMMKAIYGIETGTFIYNGVASNIINSDSYLTYDVNVAFRYTFRTGENFNFSANIILKYNAL